MNYNIAVLWSHTASIFGQLNFRLMRKTVQVRFMSTESIQTQIMSTETVQTQIMSTESIQTQILSTKSTSLAPESGQHPLP